MDANQLEQYGVDEFAKLEKAYGGEDKLQEKQQAAAVMIEALDKKTPGLKNLLKSKGIGDNALVVAQIIGEKRTLARSPQRAVRCHTSSSRRFARR